MKQYLKIFLMFMTVSYMLLFTSCTGQMEMSAEKDADKNSETDSKITQTLSGEEIPVPEESLPPESDADILPEETVPVIADADVMIDIPYISQEGILPNGCEAVSCTMLLQYYGFDIDALDFARNHLIKDVFEKDSEGRVFGPDPELCYAGDPELEDGGFGCFPAALKTSLEGFLSSEYSVNDLSGKTMKELTEEYLSNGIPVILWMTVDMEKTEKFVHWYDKSEIGSEDPREISYPANLHVMVLCGFDGENFFLADPYESRGVVSHHYTKVIEIYESMGSRALSITKNF